MTRALIVTIGALLVLSSCSRVKLGESAWESVDAAPEVPSSVQAAAKAHKVSLKHAELQMMTGSEAEQALALRKLLSLSGHMPANAEADYCRILPAWMRYAGDDVTAGVLKGMPQATRQAIAADLRPEMRRVRVRMPKSYQLLAPAKKTRKARKAHAAQPAVTPAPATEPAATPAPAPAQPVTKPATPAPAPAPAPEPAATPAPAPAPAPEPAAAPAPAPAPAPEPAPAEPQPAAPAAPQA